MAPFSLVCLFFESRSFLQVQPTGKYKTFFLGVHLQKTCYLGGRKQAHKMKGVTMQLGSAAASIIYAAQTSASKGRWLTESAAATKLLVSFLAVFGQLCCRESEDPILNSELWTRAHKQHYVLPWALGSAHLLTRTVRRPFSFTSRRQPQILIHSLVSVSVSAMASSSV